MSSQVAERDNLSACVHQVRRAAAVMHGFEMVVMFLLFNYSNEMSCWEGAQPTE